MDKESSKVDSKTDFLDGINSLVKSINKKLGEEGGTADVLGNIPEPEFFVSTGSTVLDTIIRNKPNGGLPVGRVVEIFGPPSSGKSLLASHALATTQKMGGFAVYIDNEAATSKDFLQRIGVDISTLVQIKIPTVEDTFMAIEQIVRESKEKIKAPFVTIVWDSIAGTSDKREMEKEDYASQGYGMQKAKAMSEGFRRITNLIADNNVLLFCTNQIRDNLNAGYGQPKYATPGGWALSFYASIRLEIKRVTDIKQMVPDLSGKETEQIIGTTSRVTVVKSRIAPPKRNCELNIFFSKGVDDEDSWFEALLARGAFERPTAQKYKLVFDDGKEYEFKKSDWKKIVRENNLQEKVKNLVVESHIIELDENKSYWSDEKIPDLDDKTFEEKFIADNIINEDVTNVADNVINEDVTDTNTPKIAINNKFDEN